MVLKLEFVMPDFDFALLFEIRLYIFKNWLMQLNNILFADNTITSILTNRLKDKFIIERHVYVSQTLQLFDCI